MYSVPLALRFFQQSGRQSAGQASKNRNVYLLTYRLTARISSHLACQMDLRDFLVRCFNCAFRERTSAFKDLTLAFRSRIVSRFPVRVALAHASNSSIKANTGPPSPTR